MILIMLFFILALFYIKNISLTTSDIGRHLQNGFQFLHRGTVFFTNSYSYPEINYPTITHHWGAGVVYYGVYKLLGFTGLVFFNAFTCVMGIMLAMISSIKKSGFQKTLIVCVTLLPLLAFRTEVRPESFSFLFIALFYLIFEKIKNNKILVPLLLLLQILWVNTHIFFIFGPFICGLYYLEELQKKSWNFKKSSKFYLVFSLLLLFISSINPYGITGVLTPFMILKKYGFMVAENQSILFMIKRTNDPLYLTSLIVIIISFVLGLNYSRQYKNHHFKDVKELIFLLVFGLLAMKHVRAISLFSLAAIYFIPGQIPALKGKATRLCQVFCLALLLIMGLTQNKFFSARNYATGTNIMPFSEKLGTFLRSAKIKGKVFNNYDIGSYLIFFLYPQQLTFVDNRPEAFSAKFFEETYYPMLIEDLAWQKNFQKYQFQWIIFQRHDQTEHGQPFLIRRIKDPQWIPVYVDDYSIVLARNSAQNANFIKKNALSNDIFKFKKASH
jgi:hypothetical protein